MFSNPNQYKRTRKKLYDEFPGVMQFIDEYAAEAQKKKLPNLAVELQRREALFILDGLYPHLLATIGFDDGVILTRHDSIMVSSCNMSRVLDEICLYCITNGFNGTFETEGQKKLRKEWKGRGGGQHNLHHEL